MPAETSHRPEHSEDRLPITRYLRVAGEAVLYFILVISPWAFGGVDPEWQFPIVLSTAILTFIWIGRCVFYRRITIRPDGVSLGIGGIMCLTAFQLIPLPLSIVSIISPNRAETFRQLVPETLEQIASEDVIQQRPSTLTLSADPSLTRHFLADMLVCLVVYTIARNWLATRGSIRRVATIIAFNTFALAMFGLAQFFLSQGKIYWVYQAGTSSFGPFICRNHYPFYAYIGLGLAVGFLLNHTRTEYSASSDKGIKGSYQTFVSWMSTVSQSPIAVMLLAATCVIAISIPFSLSRGGLLTLGLSTAFILIVASVTSKRQLGGGLLIASAIAILVFSLGAWLGWGPIERRLNDTIAQGAAADDRSDLWMSSLRIAKRFILFGSGANTYQRLEPAYRTSESAEDLTGVLINDSVHNEYLEALCEGGPLRLIFTLLIVYTPIRAAILAYRRLQNRSVGTIALGIAFGLFAVATHSIFDFGIHLPAIALLAATVAAFAQAASGDPDFHPMRRVKTSGTHTVGTKDVGEDKFGTPIKSMSLVGPPAIAAAVVVVIAMGLIVRQYRLWDRAERYATAAIAVSRGVEEDRFDRRIALCGARVGLSPDDPESHSQLSRAYFEAAIAAEPGLQYGVVEKESIPEPIVKKYIEPGLRAARNARSASVYIPVAHMRFALYRDFCVTADPAASYFSRVKLLMPYDPEAWFASGTEAFKRNDFNAATTDWKRSLALNSRQLVPIMKTASNKMKTEEIRDRLLPDDPSVLLSAADILFPDRVNQKEERRPFLTKAKKIGESQPNPSTKSLMAMAQIQYETGKREKAMEAWIQAVNSRPNDTNLRQKFAAWLESEELYEALVTELEWLKSKGFPVTDRLDSARHALDLKAIIDKK